MHRFLYRSVRYISKKACPQSYKLERTLSGIYPPQPDKKSVRNKHQEPEDDQKIIYKKPPKKDNNKK